MNFKMKKLTLQVHSQTRLPCQADHKVNISWIFVLIRKLRSSHYPAPHHSWFRYYWLKTWCFWSTPDAHQSEVYHAHHCRPSYEPSPLIHVIHMIASYTLYTWYMWYMWYTLSTCYTWFTWHDTRDTHDTYIWFTRNTLSTCYTCPCTPASLRVTLPVSRKRSWLECDY